MAKLHPKFSLLSLTLFSLNHPRAVMAAILLMTLLFAFQFPSLTIDTDPENMLEPDQVDRVRYAQLKKDFGIHDLIVVGIVDRQGIFRPGSLEKIAGAISQILKIEGVIIEDVVSLTTTENITSSGGFLKIRPAMVETPRTADDIKRLRGEIAQNPFLHEKIVSADGTALALYIPIRDKDLSHRVAGEMGAILKGELLPGQEYHLAGLPVAEDTFGHEMFIQMAVVAPLAFIGILLLVYLLFRQPAFLLPVGMDAMLAVIWAMGLLVGMGNTIHIMSSMIPVFLMPIAILDDVHILSEFTDRCRVAGDRRRALLEGMEHLYKPMLFTSVTSAVGFASLALTDIPPVRVFGLFVAFGIMAAWLFSMTIVPAVISLMGQEKLKTRLFAEHGNQGSSFDRILQPLGRFTVLRAREIVLFGMVALVVGVLGVRQIQVNDNPVKWFRERHPLRVADGVMNRLFAGTYMAYLVVEGERSQALHSPEILTYLDQVQAHLEGDPLVGKTSSIVDIVKRINLVLHDGDNQYDRIPDSPEAVGQFLFLFQSSGDPNELDNFLDRDARRANIWVQMKGGDNRQMGDVEARLAGFLKAHPPPPGLTLRWSGLTYINKVWQDLMVVGMLKAVLGSFLVVFLLMVVEFRSLVLGILSMVPLSFAILLSYGLVGWIGKDYDMPIAVCSSLSLGMAIDFAIHFLQRFRERYGKCRNLDEANDYMFREPGRAIARNAVVVSLGFLPLTVSSLTPYVTVGTFFALLMSFSTLATLLILPVALRMVGPGVFFRGAQ